MPRYTAADLQPVETEKALVAFSAMEHICFEDQAHVILKLERRGNPSLRCVVPWRTENVNVSQVAYKDQSGIITFEPGVCHIQLDFPIYEDPHTTISLS